MGLVAETTGGRVRGAEADDKILIWRGIPYAAPPVGPLRWRLPQRPRPWSGVRDATGWGAPSLQPAMPASALAGAPLSPPAPPPAEDCLFVNVTAPADARERPVLVWLHGGGYQIGSGPDTAGAGIAFARTHGIVVVTFNYRLGALGYLSLDGEEHTGAYGLHDQIALLGWVRDNIAAFGGDPRQITIYGVSAGAKSVGNLMASPLARGLFHRAGAPAQAAGLPRWPEYTLEQRFTMIFATDGARVEPDPDTARRTPWDGRDWQPGIWYQIDGI